MATWYSSIRDCMIHKAKNILYLALYTDKRNLWSLIWRKELTTDQDNFSETKGMVVGFIKAGCSWPEQGSPLYPKGAFFKAIILQDHTWLTRSWSCLQFSLGCGYYGKTAALLEPADQSQPNKLSRYSRPGKGISSLPRGLLRMNLCICQGRRVHRGVKALLHSPSEGDVSLRVWFSSNHVPVS